MRNDFKYLKEDITMTYFMAHLPHSLLKLYNYSKIWSSPVRYIRKKNTTTSISIAFKLTFKLNYGLPWWLT